MMTETMNAAHDHRTLSGDNGGTIAYHSIPGKSPGVIFLSGFMSDMTGTKAMHLDGFCRARGQAYLRFDYFGHGASSGSFAEGTIGRWADDAVRVLDEVTEGPQVLVGSSMGGWIMLLTALRRPERIAGLLGLASAPDFTDDLIEPGLTAEQRAFLDERGFIEMPDCYGGDPYPITRTLLEDGRANLVLRRTMGLDMPVRLIHGMKDEDVPWQTSLRTAQMLRSADVEVTLVKDGGHRLSEPDDLKRLDATLEVLLTRIDGAS
jgi:pimeloyl-ACP methyl ester carboxylesterase